jgi:ketosteroid isomerase-like protein
MKIRLLLALVGLAISFALPIFAQQKDTVDPQIAQQIRVLAMKYDEAINMHDAAAVAALYTQDAVWTTTTERFTVGRPSKKHMQNTISSVGSTAIMSPRSVG